MTPQNQEKLQNKFFATPTSAEYRKALALRNRRLILKQLIDEEEREREIQYDNYEINWV